MVAGGEGTSADAMSVFGVCRFGELSWAAAAALAQLRAKRSRRVKRASLVDRVAIVRLLSG
jgi:hypothetical protein